MEAVGDCGQGCPLPGIELCNGDLTLIDVHALPEEVLELDLGCLGRHVVNAITSNALVHIEVLILVLIDAMD